MTHEEELTKDWGLKRKAEALSIVAPNSHLFTQYNPEELKALQQSNRDAFDLFGAMMMDITARQNQSSELLSEDF